MTVAAQGPHTPADNVSGETSARTLTDTPDRAQSDVGRSFRKRRTTPDSATAKVGSCRRTQSAPSGPRRQHRAHPDATEHGIEPAGTVTWAPHASQIHRAACFGAPVAAQHPVHPVKSTGLSSTTRFRRRLPRSGTGRRRLRAWERDAVEDLRPKVFETPREESEIPLRADRPSDSADPRLPAALRRRPTVDAESARTHREVVDLGGADTRRAEPGDPQRPNRLVPGALLDGGADPQRLGLAG